LGVIRCNDPEHPLYLEHSAEHKINKFPVIIQWRGFDSRRLHHTNHLIPGNLKTSISPYTSGVPFASARVSGSTPSSAAHPLQADLAWPSPQRGVVSLCHADAAVPEQHRNPLDRHARQEQFDGKRISESVGVTVLDMRQVKQLSQAALPINQPHSLVLTRQSRRRSIGNCTRLERDHRCESDQERGRHPDGLAGGLPKAGGHCFTHGYPLIDGMRFKTE